MMETPQNSGVTRFMTLDFEDGSREQLLDRVTSAARAPYSYVVTPNVDHVVNLLEGNVAASVYRGAAMMLCDSRILSHMARLRGLDLSLYPGSDMTADLLASKAAKGLVIGVFGPDRAAFDDLAARYPDLHLIYLDAPMMQPDDAAWEKAIAKVQAAPWDVLLVCISFPKQEMFAHALKAAGRDRGVALCVGASVDFLTGRQTRAPRLMQSLSLEWLYRLLSQPRRMFRRYVIEAPAIFGWFLRTEVFRPR